ncbi:hypothetical protein LTR08_005080 [Meristemomyces frigidus]|nr:hypothetical protein LTR08_005080 [Meristemomyces frigidus]
MTSMSDWFTRGWTLQELLAPPSVVFCTRDWEIIGTKERLILEISAATQIPPHYVLSPTTHDGGQNGWQYDHTASVAENMNWASRRRTTRAEDSVYCLLGLFGVSMPLLYGEGAQNAFGRLQLEILSKSDDETIFAWTAPATAGRRSSMLAPSPAAFGHYLPLRDLTGNLTVHDFEERAPYAITNKGLRFSATAKRAVKSAGALLPEGTFAVPLNCYYRASGRRYIILLLSLSEVGGTQIRIRPDAGPEDLDELMRACQWEDVGLMEFYVR